MKSCKREQETSSAPVSAVTSLFRRIQHWGSEAMMSC